MRIDSAFPGGNIVVERVAGGTVWLHQDLRDTAGDWFYWCFRVRGAAGRTWRCRFTRSRALGARGPAVSVDGGTTWNWLAGWSGDLEGFVYTCAPGTAELRFSFAMPYQRADWDRFAAGLPESAPVRAGTLCPSERGRPVPVLYLGPAGAAAAARVILTCRHHCCETMASYALEGLIDWFLRDPGAAAARLRASTELLVVPLVDLDGVEAGDQGKNRQPRDHNRDYDGASLYAVPRALRTVLPAWSSGRLRVALDLHCPWLAGGHNETVYLVGAVAPRSEAAQRRFAGLLEDCRRGPLPAAAADFLPFGVDWNTAANFVQGRSFADWAGSLPGVSLATSIEIPYASARGVAVTADSARRLGADLGAALAAYLSTPAF